MMLIYLKATGLTARSFDAIDWSGKPHRNLITGETLRGYLFEVQLSKRRIYNFIISADQILNQTDVDFFESFFLSSGRQISFNNVNWIDVIMETNEYPGDYVDGIKTLHEVNLTLMRKDPVATRATGETQY